MANNRIVIDTNVFISSIIGQYGFAHKIFEELVLSGEVTICLSEQLLSEYKMVAERQRFRKIPNFVQKSKDLIDALVEIAEFYTPTDKISFISDDPDNRVLEIAVEAQAEVIVTGNSSDFSFKEFEGILTQTPREYYENYMN